MSKDIHTDPVILDRLIDFLYPCDEKLTDNEVDQELNRLGIDIKPALQRVQKLLEAHKAQNKLAVARQNRLALGKKLQGFASPIVENIRESIKDRISKLPSDSSQLVFFHKLQAASTEEDLQTLLDDLEKLKAMQEFTLDSQSQ